jgi:hypothetical protein
VIEVAKNIPEKGEFPVHKNVYFYKKASKTPIGMRRLLLLIVIGISMRPVSGQGVWERGRDSLLNALKHAKTDSAAGVTMIYLAAQYEYNNQDSALYFSRRAYQASERAHSLWGMVNGLSVQAGILADQFKLIEAIALDSQAIVLSAKANFKPGLAGVYNNIAIAYDWGRMRPVSTII